VNRDSDRAAGCSVTAAHSRWKPREADGAECHARRWPSADAPFRGGRSLRVPTAICARVRCVIRRVLLSVSERAVGHGGGHRQHCGHRSIRVTPHDFGRPQLGRRGRLPSGAQ
jgi:hypothetical protein